jgi:hypothetical protein
VAVPASTLEALPSRAPRRTQSPPTPSKASTAQIALTALIVVGPFVGIALAVIAGVPVGWVDIALVVGLFLGGTLVVLLLVRHQRELDLDAMAFEVQRERDQRVALVADLGAEDVALDGVITRMRIADVGIRSCYKRAGVVVALAEKMGKPLNQLTLAELRSVDQAFGRDAPGVFFARGARGIESRF